MNSQKVKLVSNREFFASMGVTPVVVRERKAKLKTQIDSTAAARAAGTQLVARLNMPDENWTDLKERDRIKGLFSKLNELREKAVAGERIHGAEMEKVNAILRRYSWVTEFCTYNRRGLMFGDFPSDVSGKRDGVYMARWLVTLARNGMLDRVRQCAHCEKWFFASMPKKIFCSTECQQAEWRSTPEFKEHNRKYQLKHYHDYLSPKARHLQATRKRKKGGK